MRRQMMVLGALAMAAGLSGTAWAGDEADDAGERVERRFAVRGPVGAFAYADGGFVGVSLEELNAEELRTLKLEDQGGARVTKVVPGGPAEKAGVKDGDVIVRFLGEPVVSARRLVRMVHEMPPGRTVKLEVRRDGAPLQLSLTIGDGREIGEHVGDHVQELLDNLKLRNGNGRGGAMLQRWRDGSPRLEDLLEEHPSPRRLGIQYQVISGQLAQYFHIERGSGVLVTEVEADSAAAKAGMKAGDVILSLGSESIDDGNDLRKSIAKADDGATLKIKILRDGKALDLEVKLAGSAPRPRSKA